MCAKREVISIKLYSLYKVELLFRFQSEMEVCEKYHTNIGGVVRVGREGGFKTELDRRVSFASGPQADRPFRM